MKKNKNLIIIVVTLFVIGVIIGVCWGLKSKKDSKTNDNIKFASEYTKVSQDNVFVYKNIDEIINVLEHGTGIVYLGFPECPWCQQYVQYLNDVARQNGINTIYYFNIKEDRANNTEKYQKIISLLGDNLAYDDAGNKRVYVPDVTFVVKGNVVGHDNESSYDVTGKPEDYWTEEKVSNLKNKLKENMTKVKEGHCSSCEG